ncbi:hypothetical protein [Methylobacillus glycogenes]|uniref:hypothetical protein n=1 Tax=Methylobacillus glycogenes TaxID=406 RepID=UPI000A5AF65E|nr:hypothetical protein [Methylobacillus glycogenes]
MNFPFIIANSRQRAWLWVIAVSVLLLGVGMVELLGDWARNAWHTPQVRDAFWGGSAAAFATAAGTLPMLFWKQLPERIMDTLFGFGAGVMLAASAFSLVVPGVEAAQAQGASAWGAVHCWYQYYYWGSAAAKPGALGAPRTLYQGRGRAKHTSLEAHLVVCLCHCLAQCA